MKTMKWLTCVVICLAMVTSANATLYCDGSVLDENFDSTPSGNGSVPSGWSVYKDSGGNSWGGVDNGTLYIDAFWDATYSFCTVYHTTALSGLNNDFAIQFDFTLGTRSFYNNWLVSAQDPAGSGPATITLNNGTGDSVELTGFDGSVIATLPRETSYNLLLVLESGGAYSVYLDGNPIDSGTGSFASLEELYFGNKSGHSQGQMTYDNVKVGDVVPEPTTLGLIGLGALGLLRRRRK